MNITVSVEWAKKKLGALKPVYLVGEEKNHRIKAIRTHKDGTMTIETVDGSKMIVANDGKTRFKFA